MVDAEHRFNAVNTTGRVIEAGCNAHGRRKFRDAEDTQPVLAADGGAFIGAIYGEEEKAQKLGLTGDKLREYNSPTEREFQNVAKRRLNMLFAGSTEGAHRACGLFGIVATCRAQGVPAQAYLMWAVERLGSSSNPASACRASRRARGSRPKPPRRR